MTAFADSSALVKLYADEPGQKHVLAAEPLVLSQLARVEVPSAIWRKQRVGELDVNDAQVLTAAFEADYFGDEGEFPRFLSLATTPAVLDEAARLCAVHGLRAYDAVQLSSALAARAAVPGCQALVAFDARLRGAAAAEGLDLLPGAGSGDLPA